MEALQAPTRLRRIGSYEIQRRQPEPPYPLGGVTGEDLAAYWERLIRSWSDEMGERDQRSGDDTSTLEGSRARLLARYSLKITIKTTESILALLHEILAPDAPFVCDGSCPHVHAGLTAPQAKSFLSSLEAAIDDLNRVHKDTPYDHPCYEDELEQLAVYERCRRAFEMLLPEEPPPPRPPPLPRTRVERVRRRWVAKQHELLNRLMDRTPLFQTEAAETGLPGERGARVHEKVVTRLRDRLSLVRELIPSLPRGFADGTTASPHDTESAFDPNLFLHAFQTVTLQEGLVLDYVWKRTGAAGAPLVYARHQDELPLRTAEEYEHRFPPGFEDIEPPDARTCELSALCYEDTVRGLFELGVFLWMLPQFHLWGTAEDQWDDLDVSRAGVVEWDETSRNVWLATVSASGEVAIRKWNFSLQANGQDFSRS